MASDFFNQQQPKTFLQDQQQAFAEASGVGQSISTSRQGQQGFHQNLFATPEAQLFASFYRERHTPGGHLYVPAEEQLSYTQQLAIAGYTQQRSRENRLRDQGYSEADIALMRKWNQDIQKSARTGKPTDLSIMMSPEYSAAATQEFQYNEAMYSRYVSAARQLQAEDYVMNGDGTFNFVEDVLNEFDEYSDTDLGNTYDWMTSDQKRLMAFDGIHSAQQFVDYVRDANRRRKEADEGGFLYGVGNFFKGIGAGIISGVMDIVKIPTTVISLTGALFSGSFDNPISRAMGSANKWIDENTVEAYADAVDLDRDSLGGKIGNWVGQGIEIAAEVALTGGIATAARAGAKMGVKAGEKLIEKGTIKASEKLVAKGAAKVQKYSAKAIESLVAKEVKKAGGKATRSMIEKAAIKVGGHVETQAGLKALEHGVSGAVARLSRRGMFDLAEKVAVKVGEKGVEKATRKGIERVATAVATKGAEKAVEKTAVKAGEKVVEKKLSKESIKKLSDKVASGIRKTYSEKRFGAFNKALRTGTQEHIVASMATKPTTLIGKTFQRMYGKSDPFTKLFAIKSFAGTVQNGQARGDTPYSSLARALFAYGTTQAVWGGMHSKSGSAIARMFERNGGVGAKAAESSVMRFLMDAPRDTIQSATKMWTDGTLQQFIQEGLRKGDDGKLNIGFFDALKDHATIEKIGESFLTAFTMHMTGGLTSGANSVIKKGLYKSTPMMREKAQDKVMQFMDERMASSETGLSESIWNSYKIRAREQLGKNARDGAVIDRAAALAAGENSYIADMVQEKFIQGYAKQYGVDYRRNLEDISEYIDDNIRDINERNREIIDQEYDDEKDLDINRDFRKFAEVASMNNANLFDGTEIPEDLAKLVDNHQPKDFMMAYAMFKNNKVDLSKLDHKTNTAIIKKSFEDAARFRKSIGERNYNRAAKLSFNTINKISEKMADAAEKDRMVKWLEFHDDLKELLKSNPEDLEDRIEQLIFKHDYTKEKLNNVVAAGPKEAQDDLRTVGDAMDKVEEEREAEEKEKIDSAKISDDKRSEYISEIISEQEMIYGKDSSTTSIETFKELNKMMDDQKMKQNERALFYEEAFNQIKNSKSNPDLKLYSDMVDVLKANRELNDALDVAEKVFNSLDSEFRRYDDENKKTQGVYAKQIMRDISPDLVADYNSSLRTLNDIYNSITNRRSTGSKTIAPRISPEGLRKIWKDVNGKDLDLKDLTEKIEKFKTIKSKYKLTGERKEVKSTNIIMSYETTYSDPIKNEVVTKKRPEEVDEQTKALQDKLKKELENC